MDAILAAYPFAGGRLKRTYSYDEIARVVGGVPDAQLPYLDYALIPLSQAIQVVGGGPTPHLDGVMRFLGSAGNRGNGADEIAGGLNSREVDLIRAIIITLVRLGYIAHWAYKEHVDSSWVGETPSEIVTRCDGVAIILRFVRGTLDYASLNDEYMELTNFPKFNPKGMHIAGITDDIDVLTYVKWQSGKWVCLEDSPDYKVEELDESDSNRIRYTDRGLVARLSLIGEKYLRYAGDEIQLDSPAYGQQMDLLSNNVYADIYRRWMYAMSLEDNTLYLHPQVWNGPVPDGFSVNHTDPSGFETVFVFTTTGRKITKVMRLKQDTVISENVTADAEFHPAATEFMLGDGSWILSDINREWVIRQTGMVSASVREVDGGHPANFLPDHR